MEVQETSILGFKSNEYNIIKKKLSEHKIRIDSFNKRYELVYNEFSKLGYDDKSIKIILIQEPRIIYCNGKIKSRLNNMENKILSKIESDLNIIPRAIIFTEETLTNKYNALLNLGFKKEQIKYILEKDPKFITRSIKSIQECFNYLINIGIDKNKVIKIFIEYSKIICQNNSLLDINFNKLLSFGFTKEEAATLVSN